MLASDAIYDWVAGKTFKITDSSMPFDGMLVDVTQADILRRHGIDQLVIEYNPGYFAKMPLSEKAERMSKMAIYEISQQFTRLK
jgi:hypothetical protein